MWCVQLILPYADLLYFTKITLIPCPTWKRNISCFRSARTPEYFRRHLVYHNKWNFLHENMAHVECIFGTRFMAAMLGWMWLQLPSNVFLSCHSYLFPEASTHAPRQIRELDGKAVVGIALGPDVDFPNAYFHLSSELLAMIELHFCTIGMS